MILAGDIGGTKTVLALVNKGSEGTADLVKEQTFSSQDFTDFNQILDAFLPDSTTINAACFGIAGPVVNQQCQMTNLSWSLDGTALKSKLGTDRVKLLNDLEAMAMGMLHLSEDELVELNPNAIAQTGHSAVIAAGTGLGEAILYWDGQQYHPMATEGGHCDFAPQTPQQDKLLTYLRKIYPDHVSCERLVSGMGFGHLYDFLCEEGFAPASANVPQPGSGIDRNAIISQLGLTGDDPLCAEVVRLFVELYGAEAGNLALKTLALGGIFVGGGIGPKIQSAMTSGLFLDAFCNKGRYRSLLQNISIKMSLNERTPLIGAINFFQC